MDWQNSVASAWNALVGRGKPSDDAEAAPREPDRVAAGRLGDDAGVDAGAWRSLTRDWPTEPAANASPEEVAGFANAVEQHQSVLRYAEVSIGQDSGGEPILRASNHHSVVEGPALADRETAERVNALGRSFFAEHQMDFSANRTVSFTGGYCFDSSDAPSVARAEAEQRSVKLIEAMLRDDAARVDDLLAQGPIASISTHLTDGTPGIDANPCFDRRRFAGPGEGFGVDFGRATPLDIAARLGRADFVAKLLPHSVCENRLNFDPQTRTYVHQDYPDIDESDVAPEHTLCDLDRGSALLAAATNGHADCVRLLWDAHEAQENFNAAEVLSAAMVSQSPDTLAAVLERATPAATDWQGCDGLGNAIRLGRYDLADNAPDFLASAYTAGGAALWAACDQAARGAPSASADAMRWIERLAPLADEAVVGDIAMHLANTASSEYQTLVAHAHPDPRHERTPPPRLDAVMDALAPHSVIAAAAAGRPELVTALWPSAPDRDFDGGKVVLAAMQSRSRETLDAAMSQAASTDVDQRGLDAFACAVILRRHDLAAEFRPSADVNAGDGAALRCLADRGLETDSQKDGGADWALFEDLAASVSPAVAARFVESRIVDFECNVACANELDDIGEFKMAHDGAAADASAIDEVLRRCEPEFQSEALARFPAALLPETSRAVEARELQQVVNQARFATASVASAAPHAATQAARTPSEATETPASASPSARPRVKGPGMRR